MTSACREISLFDERDYYNDLPLPQQKSLRPNGKRQSTNSQTSSFLMYPMFQYFNRKMIFLETCFSFMFPGVFIYAKYKHAEHLIKCDMFYKKTHVKIICSCKSYDLGTGEVDFQATGTHFVSLSSDFNLTTCMNIKTFQRGRGVPPGPMVRQKTKSTKNELFKWEVRTYIFFAFAVEPIAEMYVFDVLIPFTCQMHVYHLLRYQHDHCSCAFSMASGLWHAE